MCPCLPQALHFWRLKKQLSGEWLALPQRQQAVFAVCLVDTDVDVALAGFLPVVGTNYPDLSDCNSGGDGRNSPALSWAASIP